MASDISEGFTYWPSEEAHLSISKHSVTGTDHPLEIKAILKMRVIITTNSDNTMIQLGVIPIASKHVEVVRVGSSSIGLLCQFCQCICASINSIELSWKK